MISGFARDLRLALRQCRRSPGFTVAAIVTLALGIGATTSVFSVVYAAMFRPLPFPYADRLVQIVQILEPTPNSPEPVRAGLTPTQFVDLQDRSTTLAAVGGYTSTSRTLTGTGVPVKLNGAAITAGIFGSLGVTPAIGRTFVPDDSAQGADPVVILSHDTWIRYFGADPAIVNRRIELGEPPPVVVGVMPAGFGFPSLASGSVEKNSTNELSDAPEFWMPRPLFERTPPRGQGFSLFRAFAILRQGASPEQALAEIRSVASPLPEGRRANFEVVSARREMSRRMENVLSIFQAGVLLILLIACVNVANLLLTRAARKRRETTIRLALGASRARIASEYLAESMVLAVSGGLLGCLLAYWGNEALRTLPPHLLPRMREIRIDAVVGLFAFALSVGSGVVVGLVAGLRAGRARNDAGVAALRGTNVSADRRLRPSGVAVAFEIAVAMVLLSGAALLLNSFARLMQVDTGIDSRGVVTFRIALPTQRYDSPARQQAFLRELLDQLRRLPETGSAAASSYAFHGGPIGFYRTVIDGKEIADTRILYHFVTPDFFQTLGIPIRLGREFDDRDWSPVARRVVVNEAFARRYLAGAPPIGRTITYGERIALEVVGVAGDTTVRQDRAAEPTLYLPADMLAPLGTPAIALRSRTETTVATAAIRDAVRKLDPALAAYDVTTIDEIVGHSSASARLYSLVSLWCAIIALALTGVGLYGVLAYSVSSRTREFGIRMALGAKSSEIIASVMREGLTIATTGIALGLVGAYYATQVLKNLLFGVTPGDTATLSVAAGMFLGVALAASYFPSRRATHVDVAAALRTD
jgi:predicted permease